jgi:hypothetical protein
MAIIIMCVCVCACVCPARVATPILGVLLPHAVLTPAVALYFPAAQSVQTEAPAPEYLPATQAVQTSLVCSGKPKNLPATQMPQSLAPEVRALGGHPSHRRVKSTYESREDSVKSFPSSIRERPHLAYSTPSVQDQKHTRTMPASQSVQACIHGCHSRDIPEFALYLPAGQPRQVSTAVAPSVVENLPASQLEQVATEVAPTAAENLPASHLKQALGELEKLPAGHWLSTQAEPRPANENLPAVQLVQAVDPALAAYFPAPQERQV